ncbi:MAG: DUF433 domain-containing protein [Nitrospira sp.]|nr:MAG: DUF433 domain-containing protein [Nitrospira sp.]
MVNPMTAEISRACGAGLGCVYGWRWYRGVTGRSNSGRVPRRTWLHSPRQRTRAGSQRETNNVIYRDGFCQLQPSIDMANVERVEVLKGAASSLYGRIEPGGLVNLVKDLLDLLAAGVAPEDILRDYPYLEKEDIQAVLEFAAAQSDHVMLRAG